MFIPDQLQSGVGGPLGEACSGVRLGQRNALRPGRRWPGNQRNARRPGMCWTCRGGQRGSWKGGSEKEVGFK